MKIEEVYCREIEVFGNESCGGLIGKVSVSTNYSLEILNSYTRCNITGIRKTAGFIGEVFVSAILDLHIEYSYSSNFISSNSSSSGASIGSISNNGAINASSISFLFNNQTNPTYNATGESNLSLPNFFTSLYCQSLLDAISNFNTTIWGGDSLKSQLDFSPNITLCYFSPFSTSPPTTTAPTTTSPTTTSPTIASPTTTSPTTTSPTTTAPITTAPTTTSPTTASPTTTSPTTTSPTTTAPTTTSPNTTSPTTTSPTTTAPTTTSPTTSPTTTSIPTSAESTTIKPTTAVVCIYQVENCEKCDANINKLEISNINVSCLLIENQWKWVFKVNSQSNESITLDSNLTVNSQLVFDSNLVIKSNTSISIVVSNSSITVNGCVSIEGDLSVLVDFKVDQQQQYDLINYNCSEMAKTPKQINLLYNKNQNVCLKSKSKVSSNSISAIISTCGQNRSLILGISIGIPILLILIVIVSLLIARRKLKKDVKKFKKKNEDNIEMKKRESSWRQNDSHLNQSNDLN